MFARTFQTLTAAAVTGSLAVASLSGCTVSDDPRVNAVATGAVVGTAAALIYYNVKDGRYYDNNYRVLPDTYRPRRDSDVRRIDDIDGYRRSHRRYDDRRYDDRYDDGYDDGYYR